MIFPGFKSLFWRNRLQDAGERARREHSAFLTQALRTRLGVNVPRIPRRKVDDGGFDRLMQDPRGRAAAERWWGARFEDGDG